MMDVNIRGANSKKEVLANILTDCNIDIVCVQETHTYLKNKIKIPGYYTFFKNRPKVGSKGGVAILVKEIHKEESVLIHESKSSELIAIRMCHIKPNLCVICFYGKQENTTPAAEINDDITEALNLANKLSSEGELVVLAGDWNIAVGSKVLSNNNPGVSRGGKVFNALVEYSEDLEIANVMYPGSCITHEDASGGTGRCLDIVVMNSLARERTKNFLVDETKIITPYRYMQRDQVKRYTDHIALYWEMDLTVIEKGLECPVEAWNYSKPLGDGKFALQLDKSVPKLVKCLEMNKNINVVLDKIHKEERNAKYRSYGQRQMLYQTWSQIEDERIELFRMNEVKKAVERVRSNPKNHNVPLQIFAMRKSHLMAERGDMFSSVRDPVTGKLVDTRQGIYNAIRKHNDITLSQNEGQDECYQLMTEFKMTYVETMMAIESDDPRDETIYWEDYLDTLNELQARNKSVYSDIKRWGPKFRIFVYLLLKRLYENEECPEEFLKTKLQALYKKGPRSELGNYRFLHLKTCLAKVYETLIMKKVKADIWRAYPESQIGGAPNSRTDEHLYTIMTLMRRCEVQGEGNPQGAILIYKDVKKAFDKISVKQTMYAAARAGIKGKNLRVLGQLNERTTFTVVGDSDNVEFEKEFVSSQGTVFTCTSCSKTMPDPMAELLKFEEEETGKYLGVTVGRERVRIQEVDFVDDQCSISKDAESARRKGELITMGMNQLNVECHDSKTRYMIIGTKKYKEKMEAELEKNPIVIQGFPVKRSESEKYLGMYINAAGTRETVQQQMEGRIKECQGKMAQIREIIERPTMREVGYLASLRTLFESVISSTALYSAGTWVGSTKAQAAYYDKEMKNLLYSVLRLNSRTSWLQVCWEFDIIPWSWRIILQKINLVVFLHFGKVSQSGRLAVAESTENWRHGLVAEARKHAEALGLPDPSKVPLSTDTVSEAVKDAARLEMWESVVSSKYITVEVKGEKFTPAYFYNTNMTSHEQKIWLSYRLGILEFRKRYAGKHKTTKCIFTNCRSEDTLEHSLVCEENPVKKKGDKDSDMLEYLKTLHSLRLHLVGLGVYWL